MSKLKLVSEVPTENQIKNSIIDYLLYKGALILRINSGAAMGQYQDKQGNIKQRFIRFCQWFAQGVTFKEGQGGVLDLLAIMPNGQLIIIDAKRRGKKNTLTEKQRLFIAEAKKRGVIPVIAEDVEDVRRVLE